jgi:hypothetical protein
VANNFEGFWQEAVLSQFIIYYLGKCLEEQRKSEVIFEREQEIFITILVAGTSSVQSNMLPLQHDFSFL